MLLIYSPLGYVVQAKHAWQVVSRERYRYSSTICKEWVLESIVDSEDISQGKALTGSSRSNKIQVDK